MIRISAWCFLLKQTSKQQRHKNKTKQNIHKNKYTEIDKKPLRQGTWKGSQVLNLESCKWKRDTKALSNTSSFPIAQKKYLVMHISGWQNRSLDIKCNMVMVIIKKSNLTYSGIMRGLPTGQSLPFIKRLSGCALLKDAGMSSLTYF